MGLLIQSEALSTFEVHWVIFALYKLTTKSRQTARQRKREKTERGVGEGWLLCQGLLAVYTLVHTSNQSGDLWSKGMFPGRGKRNVIKNMH